MAAQNWGTGPKSINAEISTKLEALTRAAFELAACRSANLINLAGMFTHTRAEMYACASIIRRERDQTEVSGLNLLDQIRAARFSPANQIFWRDQYATVMPSPAARSARETVEFFAHQAGDCSRRARSRSASPAAKRTPAKR